MFVGWWVDLDMKSIEVVAAIITQPDGRILCTQRNKGPFQDSFKEEKMKKENGKTVPVVYLQFLLKVPVEKSLFNYITHNV